MNRIKQFFGVFILCVFSFALQGQDTIYSGETTLAAGKNIFLENPSIWINESNNLLNDMFINKVDYGPDTAALFKLFREYMVTITMMKNSFYGQTESLNIRTVHNLKIRVADILADIIRWQNLVQKENEQLVEQLKSVDKIKTDIRSFHERADSIFLQTFRESVNQLEKRQQEGERLVTMQLQRQNWIEGKINDISIQGYIFYKDIAQNLEAKESALLEKELPPVWSSPPSVYQARIGKVLSASFGQILESVKYYTEMSLWRLIIFRGLILLLCLVPIKIFNDQKRKNLILV